MAPPEPITRVAVVGAGSWGTTIAALLSSRVATTLWARRGDVADEITESRTNAAYLPGCRLPDELVATCSIAAAVAGAGLVVVAVPSHGFRAVLAEAAAHVGPGVPVVSLAKGLEPGTGRRMTEIVADLLPGSPAGALTGPNLAAEVLAGQPTASVLAMVDEATAARVQPVFHTAALRIYTNPDVVGCEVAGAVKNVIAIAAGMVEGMGFGDNTKATVVTRGLAELTRLGVALGGDARTFAGLAGMGDLVATCSSARSRNHGAGVELGRGVAVAAVSAGSPMVAEGIRTSAVVCELAEAAGVDMPLAQQVRAVCHAGATAADAVAALLARPATSELR